MFALLMDYVAESEGEKALEENRVLQEDPDAEVPQEVRRACLKEIHRAFRKKSARSVGRITVRVINKVALVALLGTLLFSTAFAISPEFRVGTLNMLIDTVNEGVSFRISTQPVSERAGLEDLYPNCSATSFLRNWDSILEKKRANLRSISEPARLRQPPPRSTGAAHARGRAQSIREERRIAAPPVLFALLWVRLLPALYGPFCGPLRPFGGCPWGVTPPARECLPPAPPDTRRRG